MAGSIYRIQFWFEDCRHKPITATCSGILIPISLKHERSPTATRPVITKIPSKLGCSRIIPNEFMF